MRTLILATSLVATGCASHAFVRETPIAGKGVVYVYRPSRFVGAAVNGVATLVSGSQLTRSFPVRNNKYVVTPVDTGRLVLTVAGPDGKPTTFPVEVAEAGAAFVRCELTFGAWAAGMHCAPVPAETGEREVAACKRNERGD